MDIQGEYRDGDFGPALIDDCKREVGGGGSVNTIAGQMSACGYCKYEMDKLALQWTVMFEGISIATSSRDMKVFNDELGLSFNPYLPYEEFRGQIIDCANRVLNTGGASVVHNPFTTSVSEPAGGGDGAKTGLTLPMPDGGGGEVQPDTTGGGGDMVSNVQAQVQQAAAGMSTGTKVAIGVAVVAGLYFIFKR
jgi:hypothetical protein